MAGPGQNIRVTVGTVAALAAGVSTVGATVVGVQFWVDDRISDRTSHIERRLDRLDAALAEQVVRSEAQHLERYRAIEEALRKLDDEKQGGDAD